MTESTFDLTPEDVAASLDELTREEFAAREQIRVLSQKGKNLTIEFMTSLGTWRRTWLYLDTRTDRFTGRIVY